MATDFTIREIKVPETLKWAPLPQNLPQVPFRMGIFACSGGGKTTLLVNLLMNKNFYRGYFDRVIIWSPTIKTDPTWKALLDLPAKLQKKIHFKEKWVDSELQSLMKWQESRVNKLAKGNTLPVLLIFDDMIGTKIMKSSLFQDLFFSGRHLHFNLILSFQAYKKVDNKLRGQLTDVVVLNVQRNELDKIAEEQANPLVSNKMFLRMYNELKDENPHNFLYRKCTLGDMSKQYFKCFTDNIDIQSIEDR